MQIKHVVGLNLEDRWVHFAEEINLDSVLFVL